MPSKDQLPVLDFSNNLNPYGPPPEINDSALTIRELVAKYGSSDALELKQTIARFLGIDSENVGVGIGATQILFALPEVLQATRAIIPRPTFWEYGVANERSGVPILYIELDPDTEFTVDLTSIERQLSPGDALYLPNISNPTSRLLPKEQLIGFIQRNPEVQVIIDETYLLFHSEFASETLTSSVQEYQNLHIALSFSKFFTIPGVRVGAIISNLDMVKKYTAQAYIPYSMAPVAIHTAELALQSTEFIEQTRVKMREERLRLQTVLESELPNHLKQITPDGNFILAKLSSGYSDEEVVQTLLEKHDILIRKGSDLIGLDKSWIRFCVRLPEENDKLVSALKSTLL